MRLPKLRFTIRRQLIAITVAGFACSAFVNYQRCSYYYSGWSDAEREIWRGHVTLYGIGLYRRDLCDVDEQTGLPIHWRGCAGTEAPGYKEWARGHDDHVKQYIRWHGLPKNSLKPWVQDLFHLARYFEDRSRIDPSIHLVAGGPPIFTPDNKDSVRPDALAHSGWLGFAIFADNCGVNSESVDCEGGECDVVWGPGGSRVVVFRSLESDYVRYSAFNLRTSELLCQEIKSRPERSREHSTKVVEGAVRAVLAGQESQKPADGSQPARSFGR
jgi:hypothetical protein